MAVKGKEQEAEEQENGNGDVREPQALVEAGASSKHSAREARLRSAKSHSVLSQGSGSSNAYMLLYRRVEGDRAKTWWADNDPTSMLNVTLPHTHTPTRSRRSSCTCTLPPPPCFSRGSPRGPRPWRAGLLRPVSSHLLGTRQHQQPARGGAGGSPARGATSRRSLARESGASRQGAAHTSAGTRHRAPTTHPGAHGTCFLEVMVVVHTAEPAELTLLRAHHAGTQGAG